MPNEKGIGMSNNPHADPDTAEETAAKAIAAFLAKMEKNDG